MFINTKSQHVKANGASLGDSSFHKGHVIHSPRDSRTSDGSTTNYFGISSAIIVLTVSGAQSSYVDAVLMSYLRFCCNATMMAMQPVARMES